MPVFGDQLVSALFQNQSVVLGLLLLLFLAFLLLVFLWRRVVLLDRRYKRLLGGLEDGKSLEEVLFTHLENVQQALAEVDQLERAYHQLAEILGHCVQNLGVVRFNAFPDTGSDLSFAVAFLDREGNGVVLSSLYGRNESRIYAKPVQKGTSNYHLTDEEKLAIQKALAQRQ